MPSAASAKTEKPTSSEANNTENLSPIRQVMVILDHKIRNLEKRKSKLTSYRDLQKSGKELNADQKVAVAKYDEVTQTLEFARDLSKQVTSICTASEKEAKKQAKKEAWLKAASETNKIRDVLLVLDCLIQLGNEETRADFITGSNGAAKLTEDDLKLLDDLYPEVTPKHDFEEDGNPTFPGHALRAAEHLCCIVDAKQKDFLGTTYTRIKEIVTTVHESGYLDRLNGEPQPDENQQENPEYQEIQDEISPPEPTIPPLTAHYPSPPPPQPAYPIHPMPPITLQEVEHAYFAQQYAQQRPISEVIGSQGFFFLQESEIESPVPTPQPPPPLLPPPVLAPPVLAPPPPPLSIPTQTFTNQNFMSRAAPAAGALPMPGAHLAVVPQPPPPQHYQPIPNVTAIATPVTPPQPLQQPSPPLQQAPVNCSPPPPNATTNNSDTHASPERQERNRQHDGPPRDGRYRRYNRGGPRGHADGYRGGRSYQNGRHEMYRNGDCGDGERREVEGSEPRYDSFKGRGRGGRPRGTGPRRPPAHFTRRNAE